MNRRTIASVAFATVSTIAFHRAAAQMGEMAPRPLGISMDRMGSGTTWIPDAIKAPAKHVMLGNWDAMIHGFVFGQYINQLGPRGDDQLGSLNWGMVALGHSLAGGRVQFRTMLSLEAATVTENGYPLLLQSGESLDNEPIHDRQHPHDLFVELAVLYEREITKQLGAELYVARSGEPALGPVAFMHRPSAMDSPSAALSHHWQDATHVSFGVLTTGLFGKKWKAEVSAFNGREPDEERWNFDRMRLDSYSARLTLNPTANLSFTAGYGYFDSPEVAEPEESSHRTTASVMYGKALGSAGQWATTLVWGGNREEGKGYTHSYLAESEAVLNAKHTIYARAERVEKTASDLVLDTPEIGIPGNRVLNVGALSVGYVRDFAQTRGFTVGVGAQGTLNFVSSVLEDTYGSKMPKGLMIFARLRPLLAAADPMKGMHHHH